MRIYCTVALLVLSCLTAFAQGPEFLEYKADARSLAVAGASATKDAGAFAVWDNLGASAFSDRKLAAGAAYGLYQPSMMSASQLGFAGYGRIGERLSVAAGYRMHNGQAFDLFDEEGVLSGSFTPKAMQASVGAAYRILPILSVSLSASYISSDIGGSKAGTAFSADLGVMLRTGRLSAALVASNLGSRLDYGGTSTYSLPAHIDVGAGYRLGSEDSHHVEGNLQAGLALGGGGANAAVGVEYGWRGFFHLSGGYRLGMGEALPSYATLGAGVSFFGVGLDFACVLAGKDSPLAGSMLFNLTYAF